MDDDAAFYAGLSEDVFGITGKKRGAEGGKEENEAFHGAAITWQGRGAFIWRAPRAEKNVSLPFAHDGASFVSVVFCHLPGTGAPCVIG
jgi:hypothetical protein